MRIFLTGATFAENVDEGIRRAIREQKSNMRVFTSTVEQWDQQESVGLLLREKKPLLWNLMSYFYCRRNIPFAEQVRDASELILIDSGAHSFQKGTKVEWESYTHEYAKFIREFDRPNVIGYFEMDVDNLIGYQKVLELRKILHEESGHPEKIIPVWHRNRGIQDYKRMCDEHTGGIVAVTGFKNEDIRDEQYPMFLKEAWKRGCRLHCLGMTRKDILDKVPFDYTDSSSWAQQAIYGKVGKRKVSKEFSKTNREEVFKASYLDAMKMQLHYYNKWRNVKGCSQTPANQN